MTNMVENKGSVAAFHNATVVYCDLASGTSKFDGNGDASTKALAFLSMVAICFQVMSDLVALTTEGSEGGPKYVYDTLSAKYAVGAGGDKPHEAKFAANSAAGEIKESVQPLDRVVDVNGPPDFLPGNSIGGGCVIL